MIYQYYIGTDIIGHPVYVYHFQTEIKNSHASKKRE